jgi:hypothetical protein
MLKHLISKRCIIHANVCCISKSIEVYLSERYQEILCSSRESIMKWLMQFYASKNVGQFAPECLGQFDWIVQSTGVSSVRLAFTSHVTLLSLVKSKSQYQ